MMSEVIRQETAVFLLSVLHGIAMVLLYDLIRAVRRAFFHKMAAVAMEDLLFWITAGFLTFCFAFQNTDGVIRGYMAVGIGLGVLLYHVTISNEIVRCISQILCMEKRAASAVGHTLSKPVKKIWQIWKKMIEFARKKGYNSREKIRNKRGRQYGAEKKKTKQE